MASAKCDLCGMPNFGKHVYSAKPRRPVGYPDGALLCSMTDCHSAALVWLTRDEQREYKKGERDFALHHGIKVRVQ